MRKLLLFIMFWKFASCQYKPDTKAVELVKKANEIGLKSQYIDSIKANQALELINQAIEIDNKYFSAYYSKGLFLAVKKDIDGALLNNLKLIELRPNQPSWIIQRGLFFDIKGDTVKAQENYSLGLTKYRDILKQKDMNQDFNFRIEFISALEAQGNLNQAKIEIEKLRTDFPENDIVQTYVKEYKLKGKAELISLWKNGE